MTNGEGSASILGWTPSGEPTSSTSSRRKHGTLYVGVTSDLTGRVYQHREGLTPGFTSKYGVYHLVYFEMFGSIDEVIQREKRLKKWRRDWKINLIERSNPAWADLYDGIAHQMR